MHFNKTWNWVVCLGAMILSGCVNGAGWIESPEPTVAPVILPPRQDETAMACSTNPAGMMMGVALRERESGFQYLDVIGSGFTAGEKVMIKIAGQGLTEGYEVTTNSYAVGAEGSFRFQDAVQVDESNMSWRVYVVHARGTACANFKTE